MKTKICPKCKEEKSVSGFSICRSRKDGLQGHCKLCKGIWRDNNRDYLNEQDKIRYKNDPSDKLKSAKLYYQSNKDKIKKITKTSLLSIALYSTYHNQLTVDEEPRLAEDGKSLEVRCKYCGKYFKPTKLQVRNRTDALGGGRSGDHNLYCSDGCKYSCSIYNQKLYPKDHKPATSREVQPQLRKLVLERDNRTCQKCGSTDTLHCHHIDPVKNNPIESADVDNCITFCIECHKESHQQDGCRYKELKEC